jgi:hypothetical protein
MKIRDLYKAILEAVGAVVNDDGLISMTRPGDEPVPLMVKDKRLAMPTDKLLNAGAFNPDGALIAFHPMCENVVLNTSPVLQKLETAMTFRLTWVLRELIMQLSAVAADHKSHKKMKTRAHGLLSAMPEADEKTKDLFNKIAQTTTAVGQKKLLSLYVRQGGMFGGEKVSRLGRFFPSIVDQLDEEKRTLLGVNLRKADVPMFLALIEYILPEYRDADKYAAPSNALVAPTFHALAKVYAKVANQLNKIVDLHAAQLNDPDVLRIPTDWVDDIVDLTPYREIIPVLPGNDGEEGTKTVKGAHTKPLGATISKSGAPVIAAPAAPKPKSTGKGISVDDLIKGITPPPRQLSTFASPAPNRTVRGGWGSQQQQDEDLPPWAREQKQAAWGQPQQQSWSRGGGAVGGGRGSL